MEHSAEQQADYRKEIESCLEYVLPDAKIPELGEAKKGKVAPRKCRSGLEIRVVRNSRKQRLGGTSSLIQSIGGKKR